MLSGYAALAGSGSRCWPLSPAAATWPHRELLAVPGEAEAEPAWQAGLAEDYPAVERVVTAAAGSPTPDWRAKVEWFEACGYPRAPHACRCAAACPDAVERLAWLRGLGYVCDAELVSKQVGRTGNMAALQYLHAEGLLAASVAVRSAASSGYLPAVAWLVETPGVGVELDPEPFESAASSGSLELMIWLHERGCPWDKHVFEAAADGGNDVALEWLAERGCPFGVSGEPLTTATHKGDHATIRCLVRLGCPWGRVDKVFRDVVGVAPAKLRHLLEAGCPVEWREAEAVVRGTMYHEEYKAKLLAVLAEERARREQRT